MSDETKIPEAPDNQGKGNREAAERYNTETREYVRSGKVEEAAHDAAGQDPAEAQTSESAGKARAKEEDPEVSRHYDRPAGKGRGAC
jgi:hypothetical protein